MSLDQLERWRAWAAPARPSSMRDEPALARLRDRGEEELAEGFAALDRRLATERGCDVEDLPWNRREET